MGTKIHITEYRLMITISLNKVFNKSDVAVGNHMFKYVICRLVAERNGYNFYIPSEGFLKNIFPDLSLGIEDGPIS